MVPPYREPTLLELQRLHPELQVIIDVEAETGRSWRLPQKLSVEIQPGVHLRRRARIDRSGRTEAVDLHLPLLLPALIRRRPAYIISAELGPRSLQAWLYCLLFRRTALVYWLALSERTEAIRGPLRRYLRESMLRRADAVIVHSRSAERYVASLAPTVPILRYPQVSSGPWQHTHTLPGAASVELVYVGRLLERKGLFFGLSALDAVSRSSQKQVRLTILGSGPLEQELRRRAEECTFEVRFVADVEHDRVAGILASADALFFPTHQDEWGLVVNEALAQGLPVIGSDAAEAVVELIESGVNGFVFAADNPSAAREALRSFIELDRRERQRMHEAALRSGLAVTHSRLAETFSEAIQTALSQRG